MANDNASRSLEHEPKRAARSRAPAGPQIAPISTEAATLAEDAGQVAAEAATHATRLVADAIEQHSKHLSEGMAKAGDFYRESTEFAADRMNALLSAYAVMASGAQEIQKTYLDILQRSFAMATTGPGELMRCANLSEVAGVQQDLLRKSLDEWLESSSKLLRVSGKVAEDAVRPIEALVRHEAA